jgi:hypothetical protein
MSSIIKTYPDRGGRGLLGVLVLCCALLGRTWAAEEVCVDVLVYGGTSGGVVAAVQAARMGKTVALVCDKNHLGGMTSSGLGWTDIGHVGTDYIQGLSREFYTRVGQNYGVSGMKTTFEPHVAEAVFNDLVRDAGVLVYTNQYLVSAVKQGPRLLAARMNTGTLFRAKEFIDCSYTGDLMAASGVTYTVGRESQQQYGESLAGIRPPDTSFGSKVNPYVVSNNPASGLLPLVQSNSLGARGAADGLVQTYNFRMCFTQVSSNRLALTAPTNYDAARYELLARYLQANSSLTLSSLMTLGTPVPNSKMDINNNGPISTDFVGDSSAYSEASPEQRRRIWQEHKDYQQGFFYFLATDPRVPSAIQSAMLTWGPCKDEFSDNGGWPWELYVRESRRMVSDYVMTQSNAFSLLEVSDSVGLGAYFTDSHYCQRVVNNDVVVNEGTARGDVSSPYPISYRALAPRANECVNLLVPWSLSASHIAFCSLRMEPVFMILGQAAATAACQALDDGAGVQDISVSKLQTQLVADSQNIGSTLAATGGSAVVVDNGDNTGVAISGTWLSSSSSTGYYGTGYLHDGNTNKGLSSVQFTPDLPQSGSYQVLARWTANANRSTQVPIEVVHPRGTNTVWVDQTAQGGQWVPLLTTNFNAGTNGCVRIRNAGTTGYVIADAVEFVYAQPSVNLWARDAQSSRYGPEAGSFTLCRSGSTNASLTVYLQLGGTAVNGSDYEGLPSSIVLPAGVAITNVTLMPRTNALPMGDKVAVVGIAPSPGYIVGDLSSASIRIGDVPLNAWRQKWFGSNAGNGAVAGDNANPSRDGVCNLMKYALGLNPNEAVTAPLYVYGRDTNGCFAFSYTRPDPPPVDIVYQVVACENLMEWSTNSRSVLASSIVLNSNGTATVTSVGPAPIPQSRQGFLGLKVSRR